MNEEKAIERKAAEEGAASSKGDRSSSSPRAASDEPHKDAAPPEPQFNITTSTSYEESLQSPKPRKTGGANPWTSEEDSNLSRGYQKYGFQWTAIAKDSEFKLGHRTGAQVRDRFRMKYPIVYQSSVPLPLPDAGKRAPRKKGHGADDAPNPSQLTFIMHDTNTAPGRASSTSSTPTASAARRPRPALPAIQPPPEQSVPSLSSQGSSPGTPAVMLPDRFSGLHVQPLPDPSPQVDDSDDDMQETPAGSSDRDEPVADAEEVRHLSILGLLNEDNESHERLPSWKYALDEWDSGGGSGEGAGGVTLPPLLSWEEMNGMGMGSRHMFDLE
jgi:Myb-like DNA-binding domain